MEQVGVCEFVCAVRRVAFAQGRGSFWKEPQKRGAVFIGLVCRDLLSGFVLFKSIMSYKLLIHMYANTVKSTCD